MESKSVEVLLARQPIIDRQGRPVAYELLFRDAVHRLDAGVTDNALATAHVVQQAFRGLGIRTVVGGNRAFINFDAECLHDAAVLRLPSQGVVLEILETVVIDATLIERCRALKAMGYQLALDDFSHFDVAYAPLMALIDIVKVDVMQLEPAALEKLVRQLRIWPTRILAEKIDSRERARHCLALGFDLFQGFFYGRPQLIET